MPAKKKNRASRRSCRGDEAEVLRMDMDAEGAPIYGRTPFTFVGSKTDCRARLVRMDY